MSPVDYKLLLKRTTQRVERDYSYRLKSEDWLQVIEQLLEEKLLQGELYSTLESLSIGDLVQLKKEVDGGKALKKPRGRPTKLSSPISGKTH